MKTIILSPSQNRITSYSKNEVVLFLCDATDAPFTIQLPPPDVIDNDHGFLFVKSDTSSNQITITCPPGCGIGGWSLLTLYVAGNAYWLAFSRDKYVIAGAPVTFDS